MKWLNVTPRLVLLVAICGAMPTTAVGRTWHIAADGSGEAPTIQAGIDSASAGDEVTLSPGRYSWSNQGGQSLSSGPTMIVLKHGIRLRGEGSRQSTILDAEGLGRVMYIPSNATCTIEGLTVTGGRAKPCFPLRCGLGGGILALNTVGSVIKDNIITHNYAPRGGGGIWADHGSVLIQGNVISLNVTEAGGNGGAGIGVAGSIAFVDVVSNSIVANEGDGIAMGDAGGAVTLNILAFNRTFPGTAFGGRGVSCAFGTPAVSCNDSWGNTGGDAICGSNNGGNLTADPQFCVSDPGQGAGYVLQSDSPCAAGANPCGVRIGAYDVGCSTVGIEPITWSRAKNLFR